jgi:hypothetical protein
VIDFAAAAVVFRQAVADGASWDDAVIVSLRRHPPNWRDWAGVRVWRCGGDWVATWARDATVAPYAPD